MMQHEVAQRIAAVPGTKEYGILAVQMQAFCDVKYLFKVGRAVFKPRPEVDSAVIRMVPKPADPVEDSEGFRLFVRRAFHQRRKTLWNNLKEYYDTAAMPEATLKLRAEALTVAEPVGMFGCWVLRRISWVALGMFTRPFLINRFNSPTKEMYNLQLNKKLR